MRIARIYYATLGLKIERVINSGENMEGKELFCRIVLLRSGRHGRIVYISMALLQALNSRRYPKNPGLLCSLWEDQMNSFVHRKAYLYYAAKVFHRDIRFYGLRAFSQAVLSGYGRHGPLRYCHRRYFLGG